MAAILKQIPSKEDFHEYLSNKGKHFVINSCIIAGERLPPLKNCPMSELKRVLSEEFILFAHTDLPHKKVPKLPELTVKAAYEIFAGDA